MIAALCNQKLMAPFTVEGSCNRTVFEIWLETCLIPLLKPGQVVIMDNASFHKGGCIEQLIQDAGCQLLYLSLFCHSPKTFVISKRRELLHIRRSPAFF